MGTERSGRCGEPELVVINDLPASPFEFQAAVVLHEPEEMAVDLVCQCLGSWTAVMSWLNDIKLIKDFEVESCSSSSETWILMQLEVKDQLDRGLGLLRDLLSVQMAATHSDDRQIPIRRLHLWVPRPLQFDLEDGTRRGLPAVSTPDVNGHPQAETFQVTVKPVAAAFLQLCILLDGYDRDRLEQLEDLILDWNMWTETAVTFGYSEIGYPGCGETRVRFVHHVRPGHDPEPYIAGLVANLDALNSSWAPPGMVIRALDVGVCP